jgi:nitric oxide reductase NorD protein
LTLASESIEPRLHSLSLLATAVASRPLVVKRAEAGDPTWTDGSSIFVHARDSSERDAVIVQAAMLAGDSLAGPIVRQLTGCPSLARRYLAVEGKRALQVQRDRLPGVGLIRESGFAEYRSASPEESLRVAASHRRIEAPPEVFGVIRPRRLRLFEADDAPPTQAATARATLDPETPELTNEDEETDAMGILAKLFRYPLDTRFGHWLSKKVGAGREQTDVAAGDELPYGGTRAMRPGSAEGRTAQLPAVLLPADLPEEGGFGWSYPEWDCEHRWYRPGWCKVVDPRAAGGVTFESRPDRALRRQLARLGLEHERHRGQPRGDELDLDAVVLAATDRAAGSEPGESLYLERRRSRRSLSVFILWDVSGSSGQKALTLDVHEHQRFAAHQLARTFAALGDRVAIYGFRSRGRFAVQLLRVKTFEEGMSADVAARLSAVSSGGYTRLGAGIRHAVHLLATRGGTDQRLLIVLSDGFTYDRGYEGTYGESDTRRSLSEARARGVGALCLAIGGTAQAVALERAFGGTPYRAAATLDEATAEMRTLATKALASAVMYRRTSGRWAIS